jgi:hypothetical protein
MTQRVTAPLKVILGGQMKVLLSLIAIVSLPSLAQADYEQSERSVQQYYSSGQAQRDREAKAQAQRIAEIPQYNKNIVAAVKYFAVIKHSKLAGQPGKTYDSTGRIEKIEFSLTNEDCRAESPSVIHCASVLDHASFTCSGLPMIEKNASLIECRPDVGWPR